MTDVYIAAEDGAATSLTEILFGQEEGFTRRTACERHAGVGRAEVQDRPDGSPSRIKANVRATVAAIKDVRR